MDETRMAEALTAYVEGVSGGPEAVGQIDLTEEERERLIPLFRLADRLEKVLQPVHPSPSFVRSLGRRLANQGKRRFALRKRIRRVIMMGAAALGSLVSIASVVGAIALLVRWLRTRTEARHAPTG